MGSDKGGVRRGAGCHARQLYRVSVVRQYGAFAIKENAERLQAELKAAGFDAIVTKA